MNRKEIDENLFLFALELTQAILSHDSHALREATSRAKRSAYATALADEIERAEDLIKSLPRH